MADKLHLKILKIRESFEPEIRIVSSSPVEGSVAAALLAEWDSPDEKKGWPWPQPGSTS
jgi:hypothetical protein